MLAAATEPKDLRTFPGCQTAPATTACGPLTHGVLVAIAAKRRRGGRRRPPGLDQCRVPPRDRQARRGWHPRAAAGRRDQRSRAARPCRAPVSRNPATQCLRPDRRCCRRDHADARPLLSAAKRPRLPRGSPQQRHPGRQPGAPAAFPIDNYVTCRVDIYVRCHVCCRGEGDPPAWAGTRDHPGIGSSGHDKTQAGQAPKRTPLVQLGLSEALLTAVLLLDPSQSSAGPSARHLSLII